VREGRKSRRHLRGPNNRTGGCGFHRLSLPFVKVLVVGRVFSPRRERSLCEERSCARDEIQQEVMANDKKKTQLARKGPAGGVQRQVLSTKETIHGLQRKG